MPSKPKPLVLIVEDEAELANVIAEHLEAAGMQTQICNRCALAMRFLKNNFANIILLDLTLPDQNGFAFMEDLKCEDINIPTIFLTGNDSEISKVKGLELGADDYVTKPFSQRELALRVKSILRRNSKPGSKRTLLQRGDLSLDREAHRCTNGDEEIELTAKEFELLATLMNRPGQVRTRDQLIEAVWGSDFSVSSRTVDTHLKRLREKIGDSGELIQTVRGVGYRFSQ